MKAAMTVWDGRISPVFDVSRRAVVLTIENGSVVERLNQDIDTPSRALKLDRIRDLGIEVLICGAISEPFHRELIARGVSVIGFVAGDMERVLTCFLAGRLPTARLCMPGCHQWRRPQRPGAVRSRPKDLLL